MLILLAGVICISFLCFCVGSVMFSFLDKRTASDTFLDLPFICLAGLSVIICEAALLSLFFPLGSWYIKLFFFLHCLVFPFLKNKHHLSFKFHYAINTILFCLLLLLMLLMASWEITHPDTLEYHIQTISWIEKYKLIPGLANLNSRFGFQGLWFPTCAVFDLNLKTHTINLLNLTVVIWFLFFIVKRVDTTIKESRNESLLWILLLAISLWNYPQIRLTVTSVSPDFIVSIFMWASLYIFLQKKANYTLPVTIVFCFTAIAIKLSSLPIIFLSFYCLSLLLKERRFKHFSMALLFSLIFFSSFITRNLVTSGYLFYPSSFPDVVNVDWKVKKATVNYVHDYVTVYARTRISYGEQEVNTFIKSKYTEWMPVWWEQLSLSDKVVLIVLVCSIFYCLLFWRRFSIKHRLVLINLFAGVVFWFFLAPDLRFGNGFIIAFIGIAGYNIVANLNSISKEKTLVASGLFSLFILVYFIYRCIYFFSPQQLLSALGIQKPIVKTFICNGVPIEIPYADDRKDCLDFKLRGSKVSDGFQPAD